MRVAFDQATFPSNTDRCQDIVTRHHDGADVRHLQLLQNAGGSGLELVLENNEAYKLEFSLSLSSRHLLCLDPTEPVQMLCRAANNTVALMRVVRKQFFVVRRDCNAHVSAICSLRGFELTYSSLVGRFLA